MWERGLKPILDLYLRSDTVAPHVGAWIETEPKGEPSTMNESLPMWERGLKQNDILAYQANDCRSPCGSVD